MLFLITFSDLSVSFQLLRTHLWPRVGSTQDRADSRVGSGHVGLNLLIYLVLVTVFDFAHHANNTT